MAKRTKNIPPKAVNTTATYKVGQELIYSDNKTMMEKTSIKAIEVNGYLLSNGIRVNFDLNRTDSVAFSGSCFIADEEGSARFQAYHNQQKVLRLCSDVQEKLSKMDKMKLTLEEAQAINKADKLFTKILTALEL